MPTNKQLMMYLCDFCQQLFETEEVTADEKKSAVADFLLCPRCNRRRGSLMAVRCANCKRIFPRLRSIVKSRRTYCRQAICPGCFTQKQAPKTIKVKCSDCGRTYKRKLSDEKKSQRYGYKRRICPLCQPAKMVMIKCALCHKSFPRSLSKVNDKKRRGYRFAICPRCFLKR